MGHHVFTDRYYTSIPLAQALHDNETASTGTSVRGKVDLPDPIRAGQTPKQGEVMAYRHDHLMALMWRAEKKKVPMVMLSTECSARMITVPSRRPGMAEQEKPTAVHTYNNNNILIYAVAKLIFLDEDISLKGQVGVRFPPSLQNTTLLYMIATPQNWTLLVYSSNEVID